MSLQRARVTAPLLDTDGTQGRRREPAEAAASDGFWDAFYSSPHPELEHPSDFARFCLAHLAPGSAVFELGCGNGRDAMYFARMGLRVSACDRSETAIQGLRDRVERETGLPHAPTLIATAFEQLGAVPPVDAVYSRFTLHAVLPDVASAALDWSVRNLRAAGQLFVEARSVNGEPYGAGIPAGRDAFIQDGHYRRFLRREELEAEMENLGLEIRASVEGRSMAIFRNEDPVVLRIVAVKP